MAPPSWQHSEDGANAIDTSPPKPRAEVKPPPFAMHDNAPSAFYSKRDELVHEQGPAQESESRKLRESFKNRNNSGGDNILSWGEDVKKPMPLGVVASARGRPVFLGRLELFHRDRARFHARARTHARTLASSRTHTRTEEHRYTNKHVLIRAHKHTHRSAAAS